MKKEKILFFGTSKFAIAALSEIIEKKYNLIGVVTTPDKPAGRGLRIKESEVKMFAKNHNIKIYQPENLSGNDFLIELKKIKPDLIIVIAFKKLPKSIWEIPRCGTFNVHASILPNYRGAAPINWAIINGEKETGLTTFFINENIDYGDILLQEKIPINTNDNFKSIHDKLMLSSKDITIKTIKDIFNNDIKPKKQKKAQNIKKAPKIFKKDTTINWKKNSFKIFNFIRGMSPYPGARTKLIINKKNNYDLIITEVSNYTKIDTELYTDKISFELKNKKLLIFYKEGSFIVEKLKISGKKEMNGLEFNNGFIKNIEDYYFI